MLKNVIRLNVVRYTITTLNYHHNSYFANRFVYSYLKTIIFLTALEALVLADGGLNMESSSWNVDTKQWAHGYFAGTKSITGSFCKDTLV